MTDPPPMIENCHCASLPDLVMVPMGGEERDEDIRSSLDMVQEHGGDQWWLYASTCNRCGQAWMIAQDDHIYDAFYLRRLDAPALAAILEQRRWPADFLTYEQVLSLGRTMSKPWTFIDPRSPALVSTAEDLRRERPDISVEEIAHLLAISVPQARRLFQKPGVIDRFRAWALGR